MSEETITLKRAELAELLEQAAKRGAELAAEEREALKTEAIEAATKTADELDRSWRQTVKEMSRVKITPDKSRILSINGYRVQVLGGQEVEIPLAYADLYKETVDAEAEVERLRAEMREAFRAKAAGEVPIPSWN